VVSHGWKINQLDIHNVFLNRTLDEEVYMQQPLGFVYFSSADRYEAWQDAIKVEIQALRSNKTWFLVPFHHSMNVVSCH